MDDIGKEARKVAVQSNFGVSSWTWMEKTKVFLENTFRIVREIKQPQTLFYFGVEKKDNEGRRGKLCRLKKGEDLV